MSSQSRGTEATIDLTHALDVRPAQASRQAQSHTTSHDRLIYRSVHFYGAKLYTPLREAATYLRQLEEANGRAPHVLCLHDEFSWEDECTDLAWRVTLVISEPSFDAA